MPGAVHVRGYSFFGESFVYVIFEDGTDPYWARSRVLEYLSQVRDKLPAAAQTSSVRTLAAWAGSTNTRWSTVAADTTSRTARIQDWFLKFGLQTVPGVAEVATVGGMVKQYQVVLDPGRMRAYEHVIARHPQDDSRRQPGGERIGHRDGRGDYLVRGKGYIKNLEDIRRIPYITRREAGAALLLQDFADVRLGPEMRRGIADLDGQGEVAGGIVVMRWAAMPWPPSSRSRQGWRS